ncbi:hypothetical protein BDZ89DRAFT_534473 [Hymenopellis radicata]|nr:hypothetical protein BDZ89DRAFT_534473 [Hymenopellis radicata]
MGYMFVFLTQTVLFVSQAGRIQSLSCRRYIIVSLSSTFNLTMDWTSETEDDVARIRQDLFGGIPSSSLDKSLVDIDRNPQRCKDFTVHETKIKGPRKDRLSLKYMWYRC